MAQKSNVSSGFPQVLLFENSFPVTMLLCHVDVECTAS